MKEAQQRALRIKAAYERLNAKDGYTKWDTADYMLGFVKDVGDLSKLVMAKQGFRGYTGDIDHDLKHEIGDCFWSLFVICNELGIVPEEAMDTMFNELEERLSCHFKAQEGKV